VAFIQGTGIQSVGSVASVSKAFASDVTSGNCLVVGCIASGTVDWTAAMVTDTLTNTYTQAIRINTTANDAEMQIARVLSSASGGPCTVTIDMTASDVQSIGIAECSLTSGAANATATGQNTGTAVVTGNIVTTGGVDVIIFALASHDGATTTMAEGGTYTPIFKDTDGTDMPISWMYKEVVSGTYTADWTYGASRTWDCCAAAFGTNAPAGVAAVAYRSKSRPFPFKPSGSRWR